MALPLSITATSQVADLVGEDTGRTLVRLAALITSSATRKRVNADCTLTLSRRVDELVTAIGAECEARQTDEISDEWQGSLEHFRTLLQEALDLIQEQEGRSYLSQVLFQARDADRLRAMSQRIKDAIDVVMVRARMQIDEAVNATTQPLKNSTAAAELEATAAELEQFAPALRTTPVSPIPSAPQLFFGRDEQMLQIVELLSADCPGRLAILGGPGIGKTSLAVAAMHNPSVVARYASRRYFIPCDAADSKSGLFTTVCNAFGIASTSRKAAERKLVAPLSTGPSLLVLDNFESAWEAPDSRADAEDVLQILFGIPHLSIIITMRGAERPARVEWTRPFIPALLPLDDAAAKQAFTAICDVSDNDPMLDALLKHLDNVPLALNLMANLAQWESLDHLLTRWEQLKTSMLTRGDGLNRLNSLDVSIHFSLESPRMRLEPHAVTLLGLLSLLPHGTMESDLQHWARDPSLARSVSTLSQNALLFRRADERLFVLAPIREFMLTRRPPSDDSVGPLYSYYFGLAVVLHPGGVAMNSVPQALAAISPEVSNIDFLLRRALKQGAHRREAIESSLRMSQLFVQTGIGSIDLLPEALSAARAERVHDLTADLLFVRGNMCYTVGGLGNPYTSWAEALTFYEAAGNIPGIVESRLRLSRQESIRSRVATITELLSLCQARHDTAREIACTSELARAYKTSQRPAEAYIHFQRAIDLAHTLGEGGYRARAQCLCFMAELDSTVTCNKSGAIARLRDALSLFTAVRDTYGIGNVHATIGRALLDLGDAASAEDALRLASASFRATGAVQADIEILHDLTTASLATCNEPSAIDAVAQMQRLLTLLDGLDWELSRRQLLRAQGQLELWHEETDGAHATLIAALVLNKQHPAPSLAYSVYEQAEILEILGQVEEHGYRFNDARIRFILAAVIFRKGGDQDRTVRMLSHLSRVLDDDQEALPLLQAVMLPLCRFGFRRNLGEALLHSGSIARRRGQFYLASHRARSALRHFEDTKDQRGSARARALLDKLSPPDSETARA